MTAGTRRALVIEDDVDLRALLVEVLSRSGFVVREAPDGASGIEAVGSFEPDLVTVDLTLPDLDGLVVCREIRSRTDAYMVILSSRAEEVDRLVGLETADDYLTKPFSQLELRARVGALLRRPRHVSGAADDAAGRLAHGSLMVDERRRLVERDGVEVDLTRTEFELLAALVREPDRVWTRRELVEVAWGSAWAADEHLVEVHMGNLRRKLGDTAEEGRFVRTVRGAGYRLGPG